MCGDLKLKEEEDTVVSVVRQTDTVRERETERERGERWSKSRANLSRKQF